MLRKDKAKRGAALCIKKYGFARSRNTPRVRLGDRGLDKLRERFHIRMDLFQLINVNDFFNAVDGHPAS